MILQFSEHSASSNLIGWKLDSMSEATKMSFVKLYKCKEQNEDANLKIINFM